MGGTTGPITVPVDPTQYSRITFKDKRGTTKTIQYPSQGENVSGDFTCVIVTSGYEYRISWDWDVPFVEIRLIK